MEIKNFGYPTLTLAGSVIARTGVGLLLSVDPKVALVYTAVDMAVGNILCKVWPQDRLHLYALFSRSVGIAAGVTVTWLTVGSVGVLPALAMTISAYTLAKLLAHPLRQHRTNQLHII